MTQNGPIITNLEAVRTLRQQRHNPVRNLNALTLTRVLEAFDIGALREGALLFECIADRDDTIKSVKPKREKEVSQLDKQVMALPNTGAAGEQHRQILDEFWSSVRVVNAYDRNERGGFRRLVKQMMTSISFRYAVHHIVWRPSGGKLRATFEFVPLWLFENRTGTLKYLRNPFALDGELLEDGEWMVTYGDGLMIACSIGYLAKRGAFNDWLIFSEKFSVPGVLGRTSAKKDSPEGIAIRDAVKAFGHDWTGVLYGDDGTHEKPIEIIQAQGNPSGMPMPAVVERVDRKIAAMYRGADLSTMSAGGGEGTGASLQEKEKDILLADDAETISETLAEVSRMVIEWHFGRGTEPLAKVELVVPVQEDTDKVVTGACNLADRGAQVSTSALMDRLNLPAAKNAGDALSGKTQEAKTQDSRQEEELNRRGAKAAKEDAENSYYDPEQEAPDLMMQDFRNALAADMQPLGDALMSAYQAGDLAAMQAALKKISAGMPELAGDSENLAAVLGEALANAWLGDDAEDVEDVENAARYNPQDQGGKGRFIPWNRSRESRGGGHRDQFGQVPFSGILMTSGQQQDRAWRGMEHVMATQGKAPKAVVREDLGEIQFDYGNPSKESGWVVTGLEDPKTIGKLMPLKK